MCQMITLTSTFVPYVQFDLDIILKVKAAIYLNLADLNCCTNFPKAINQVTFNVS